jgi:hypothetical protein
MAFKLRESIVKPLSGVILIWWPLRDDGTPARYIHRFFWRELWRESSAMDRLKLILGVIAWPITVSTMVAVLTWRNGALTKRRSGTGIFRQIREQYWLAATKAILPPWYYIFDLYEEKKRHRAGEYLNRFEIKLFAYRYMRDHNGGLPAPAERTTLYLSHKDRFSERCAAFGVPAVENLMMVDKGAVAFSPSGESLPPIDLFLKRRWATGGLGSERWEYVGAGAYRDLHGAILTEAGLLERLKGLSLSTGRPWLVQPRVVNHPLIADLSNGVLSTIRVVTVRNEKGEFEITNAALRMAQHDHKVVDNFHSGGIVAKVDIVTGIVGRATDGAVPLWPGKTGWCERHPTAGGQILGRQMPFWEDICAMTRRAHTEAFSDHVLIGWDVAIGPKGPLLIEANKGPDTDLVQKSLEEPLGNTRFGQLIAYNLKRSADVARAQTLTRVKPSTASLPAEGQASARPK